MRLKLIACEVFYRELCLAAAQSPHQVDVEFLPKGLHDLGCQSMLSRLQEQIAAVDCSKFDAILMGYALCNNGLVGLSAPGIPLIVPIAHDCISLFLGSRQRYQEYFDANPGTYFKTTGWIERGAVGEDLRQFTVQHKHGMDQSYEALVEKYGEENAKYLFETLCNTTKNYGQFTFIEMGLEPNDSFERTTREEAQKRGWKFEKIRGDMGLLTRLINGPWDPKEFLTVAPGQRVVAKYDGSIMGTEAGGGAGGLPA